MRFLCALVALAFAGTVVAATPREVVQQAVQTIAPNAKVDEAQESVVPGFYEAIVGSQFIYVSKDGRYVLDGSAFDVANQRDLTQESRAKVRKLALEKIGPDKRIVFAPKAPVKAKHTVTVFTDIDCPFCRRFHEQIAQYNAKGIAVDYLFYPLSIHPGADKKAQAVWCSKDRTEAFTAAMSGKDPGTATCPNPINELASLAQSLGINATPTILGPDGKQIPGQIAMSPDLLAAELDRQSAALAAKN
ncbi:MAG: DsbC family protein [Dokdonella sp.]|uniref:DsbC family protein n=1 Tax=Dokdonella sp. TaxID=2291710 RepID=UPI0025B8D2C5|nr:DsbC family protein [Dokdonella sp.]MBZ0223770.1 DsbC family protein [Dokdonella sp.]MCC7254802.1 DsbC family protein [Dokdonella sp.]